MSIVPIEAIAITSAGFVCGLGIGYGFVLQAIRQIFAARWSRKAEAAWIFAMVLGMVFITLAPVFLMVYMVFGDDPNGPLFWPRMGFFVLGLVLGAGFSFGSAWLIHAGLRGGGK